MKMIVSARTSVADMEICRIDVRLSSGRIVSLNWETSTTRRNTEGFVAEYRNVTFDSEELSEIFALNHLQVIDIFTNAKTESALDDFAVIHMAFDFGGGASMTVGSQNLANCTILPSICLKDWVIPVYWEMAGQITVKAPTLSEAIRKVTEDNSIPLPNGNYVDDSFEAGDYDEAYIRSVYNNGQEDAEDDDEQ